MQSGGITRFKFHLSGKEVYKNVKVCPNVPPEVKKLISQLQPKKKKKKTCKWDWGNSTRIKGKFAWYRRGRWHVSLSWRFAS